MKSRQRTESDVLSVREYEILRLIALGRSNAQVAQTLGISTHTVKNHLSNIFEKLGARSRTQAVVFALGQQFSRDQSGSFAPNAASGGAASYLS